MERGSSTSGTHPDTVRCKISGLPHARKGAVLMCTHSLARLWIQALVIRTMGRGCVPIGRSHVEYVWGKTVWRLSSVHSG